MTNSSQSSSKKPQLSPRVHPEDRAKINALNSIAQTLHGSAEEKAALSYYTPILIQCTLPHSDPKTATWVKTNGDFTLMVTSGIDKEGNFIGIPYGSFPRLVVAYIVTRVKETKERRLELSSNFGGFLKEIGYTGNLRGHTRASKTVQSQLLRLLKSNIEFEKSDGNTEKGSMLSGRLNVADTIALWWDYKQPEQGSLWGSYIELSENFHKAILANPVPLRTDILSALRKSPLALDVYMWVSYRLYTLQNTEQDQVTLGYGRLQEQFGTGISEANYRSFRRDFKNALARVAQYWLSPDGEKELLHYELHEDGLTLYRSPLLVSIPKRKIAEKAAAEEVTRILTTRKFDDITMKHARQVAGSKWDIRWLEAQYFEWIERENIVPDVPRRHFISFIKSHIERNAN